MKEWLRNNYHVFILILIFLFSYWIRSFNIIPDNILGYDPTFQYRFTKYAVLWGHIPEWDELSYYVGRSTNNKITPLMPYLTALIHVYILKGFGFSLMTSCAYMSAIYGALIVFPAFFLAKRLSNKYGGLLAAALIGTAPQILIRTFGGSYDTDQIAIFFILLNLYLGLRFLQKKTIANLCFLTIGLISSYHAWIMSIYSFIIIVSSAIIYFIVNMLLEKHETQNIILKLKNLSKKHVNDIIGLFLVFILTFILEMLLKKDMLGPLFYIITFATNPARWIVNISIAELQPVNIFNIQGIITAIGNIATGIVVIDIINMLSILIFMVKGLTYNYKKNNRKLSFLITLFVVGIYTTFRGVRFTEFSSVIFLIIVACGFGYFINNINNKNNIVKSLIIWFGIFLVLTTFSLGIQYGRNTKYSVNPNWDDTWEFIKTNTPEDAIVGTWWDPGHMIAALGERRNFADGAHCGNDCMYTINDRITDLGRIMVTENETESLKLIQKYKGTSSRVYWIASDDLISKYQWLQYFGTGCDARRNPSCPLYQISQQTNNLVDKNRSLLARIYGAVWIMNEKVPVPFYVQDKNVYFFKEVIYYNDDNKIEISNVDDPLNVSEKMKYVIGQLDLNVTNQTIPASIWIRKDFGYIVFIPEKLRNTVFTKMFFLEGKGLEKFRQVFRNDQVKIYEVLY